MIDREILFRGKRIDNSEWVYGYYIQWRDGSASIDDGDASAPMYSVDRSTVGQYSELKDKNGNRVFEGDITMARIVEGDHTGFTWPPAEIVFEDGAFCRKEQREAVPLRSYSACVEFEITGNVHDNPELLEEQDGLR